MAVHFTVEELAARTANACAAVQHPCLDCLPCLLYISDAADD